MQSSAREYKSTLGPKEALLVRSLAQRGKAIFTVADASDIAGAGTRELLHRLARKKWVLPLRRGLYAVVPLDVGVQGADAFVLHNFVVASMLVEPYYVGYWSALNHHGLTDQIPRTTFVATTRARHPLEAVDGEYRFVKLTARKFFGWRTEEVAGYPVSISGPEKTVADCLDHPEHCGGIEQIARAIYFSHQEIDLLQVVECAGRMGNRTVLKRLGHVLEATGLLERYGDLLRGFRPSAGFGRLDPLSPPTGRHDGRWGLVVNFRLDPEGWGY